MDFSTALKSFALLDISPKMEDLKAEALEQGQESPLMAMMGIKHIDDEGKTIVNTAGAGSGAPPDDWYLNIIARAESLRRAIAVANNIEPVRLHINNTIAIEERHINPIVWQSAFVPRLQAPLSGRRQLRDASVAGCAHVNSAQTYEAAALAGLGLIQAPLLGIGRYLESGALVEIIPDFRRRTLAVSLVVAHRSNLSRRVRAFMKWIEGVLTPYLE